MIAYLDSVDLSALSMQDLHSFANTVNVVRGMTRPDYLEHLMKMTSSGFALGKADQTVETGSEYAIVGERTTA